MNVTAVVVAGGGRGGVDILAPVGGVPMVAHAVRSLLGVAEHVVVLDVDERGHTLVRACAGLPVSVRHAFPRASSESGPHAPQRRDTTSGDGFVAPCSEEVVLVHDAARPLAPRALAAAVVEGIRAGHEIVVPVLPLTDTVKTVDPAGIVRDTPDRSGLRVLQTPQALRRELVDARAGEDLLAVAVAYAAAGHAVHTVPGDLAAFPVRTGWDLELAELLTERTTA
ncbi:2-C-methyl-D-erythritol 4-phosphate cytidylyltransferase [Pseudonocardia nigra]|uniref:2-C-methyl-D-erythritol 4-phosphate cytidylyltransferase n=1 Tax=Pseudonocardia nigra TaxID=1921578 RepID=UPI001C5EE11F|nr:2-C-methyl-D-erythritol 4-phosphate cytidylyltransferase [Pseudonocardia nigra]